MSAARGLASEQEPGEPRQAPHTPRQRGPLNRFAGLASKGSQSASIRHHVSRTIGGAVAGAFAREGARVFLAGRTKAKLDNVAGEIRSNGGKAETAVVDALDARG